MRALYEKTKKHNHNVATAHVTNKTPKVLLGHDSRWGKPYNERDERFYTPNLMRVTSQAKK